MCFRKCLKKKIEMHFLLKIDMLLLSNTFQSNFWQDNWKFWYWKDFKLCKGFSNACPATAYIFSAFLKKPLITQFANEGHMNEGCHASLAYGTDFLDSCWSSQKAISMCAKRVIQNGSCTQHVEEGLCEAASLFPIVLVASVVAFFRPHFFLGRSNWVRLINGQ